MNESVVEAQSFDELSYMSECEIPLSNSSKSEECNVIFPDFTKKENNMHTVFMDYPFPTAITNKNTETMPFLLYSTQIEIITASLLQIILFQVLP